MHTLTETRVGSSMKQHMFLNLFISISAKFEPKCGRIEKITYEPFLPAALLFPRMFLPLMAGRETMMSIERNGGFILCQSTKYGPPHKQMH